MEAKPGVWVWLQKFRTAAANGCDDRKAERSALEQEIKKISVGNQFFKNICCAAWSP
jgi:hypothetical protein